MLTARQKTVIGETIGVRFPELNSYTSVARVDTGATLSVLNCNETEIDSEGNLVISLDLDGELMQVKTNEYSIKPIKNSFGEVEERFLIRLLVVVGARSIRARFTLRNREKMQYDVLLGRNILKGRFLVDVSH